METTATYEFRWDVEVPGSERRYGQKFMKQWKRVLQAQKMGPLVSQKLAPREARFQVCLPNEDDKAALCEAEIASELAHLRWQDAPQERIHSRAADAPPPAGWQGVRVWMTFAREDVESALGRKPRI